MPLLLAIDLVSDAAVPPTVTGAASYTTPYIYYTTTASYTANYTYYTATATSATTQPILKLLLLRQLKILK